MKAVYRPAPEAVWSLDLVGRAFLTLATFAVLIALVGFASCWEVIQ